jgi:hypothetical protein
MRGLPVSSPQASIGDLAAPTIADRMLDGGSAGRGMQNRYRDGEAGHCPGPLALFEVR